MSYSEKTIRTYFNHLSTRAILQRAKEITDRIENDQRRLKIALSVLDERGVL